MVSITCEFVDSLAPNPEAIKNAKGLVQRKHYAYFYQCEDGKVLFGQCLGSSKDLYRLSVDLTVPAGSAFHCTCPSRQRPCKHVLGLMYLYAQGVHFPIADMPPEVIEARQRAAKKKEAPPKEKKLPGQPKKTNRSALEKKIKIQLEGLDLLEKLLSDTLKAGLGNINEKAIVDLEGAAKQLGDHYLPGPQIALRELILPFKSGGDRERAYTIAIDRIITLDALCRKGREYLGRRLADPGTPMEKGSAIEEWLGHAWQSAELKELGLVSQNEELLQLFFNSYESEARREYVDQGIWVSLNSGKVYATYNYRPFKAVKHMTEEDSFFPVAQVKELFVYPGEINRRVRWDEATTREAGAVDYERVRSYASRSYPEVVKAVKSQIKNPLSDKNPIALLYYSRIGKAGDRWAMEDEQGNRLELKDSGDVEVLPTCHLLEMIRRDALKGQALLARFTHDMDAMELYVQPLSIVTDKEIIRLVY